MAETETQHLPHPGATTVVSTPATATLAGPTSKPANDTMATTTAGAEQDKAKGLASDAPVTATGGVQTEGTAGVAGSNGANVNAQPIVRISLLLTTGARHQFSITKNYLKKRQVLVEGEDPYNLSVYGMKELIWRDWRDDWEPRPTSPHSIRLIFFGSLLMDDTLLKDTRLNKSEFNVVHMAIKPQEAVDEDEMKGSKEGKKDPNARRGLNCCVIL